MTTTVAEGGWPKTARAWIYNNGTGGLEKSLSRTETASPPPKSALSPNSVLVQVLYMSINPADYKLAELGLLARPLISPPASPGMDFSGRVVLAGEAMGAYRPGQLVYGRVDPNKYGTLAEYIVVKNGDGIAHVPEGLETKMAEFASVGTGGLTAWQAIRPYLPDNAKDAKIFINGGSGGVGTFAIQIGKALGCHVTATCSGANVELCRSLGADEVIDYKTQDVSQVLKSQGKVFQLVVDNIGCSPAKEEDLYVAANTFMKDDGHFIQIGGGASKDMAKAMVRRSLVPGFLGGGKRRWKFITTAQSHADLESIGGLMKSGAVKAVLDEVFTFDNAPQAFEKLKTGRTKGKIVIKVAE